MIVVVPANFKFDLGGVWFLVPANFEFDLGGVWFIGTNF
jgi:hypothetical protein